MLYRTTDTTEATLLKTLGFPFIEAQKIKKEERTAIQFTFELVTGEEIAEINKDYFNHALSLDAYDLIEATKFTRKAIYDNK